MTALRMRFFWLRRILLMPRKGLELARGFKIVKWL